jgi:hypothetical protein
MERRMPPWPAVRGFGDFVNDRSLSPLEIELLVAWAERGTPRGDPQGEASLLRSPTLAAPPDLTLRLQTSTPPTTPVARVVISTGVSSDHWLGSVMFTPQQPRLIERLVVSVEGGDPLASWIPPEPERAFARGLAKRLPANARLVVDVHYRKSAELRESFVGLLGLRWTEKPRHEVRYRDFQCGVTVLDDDMELLTVRPFASEAGADLEAMARRPGGSVEPLLMVRRFLPGYVPTYAYRSAVRLPRGTALVVSSKAPQCRLEADYADVR